MTQPLDNYAPPILLEALSTCTSILYLVTEEEDEVLRYLNRPSLHVRVHSSTQGLINLSTYLGDLRNREFRVEAGTLAPYSGLMHLLNNKKKDLPRGVHAEVVVYKDPQRHLSDPKFVRFTLDYVHRYRVDQSLRRLVLLGGPLEIPSILRPYIQVVHINTGSPSRIHNRLSELLPDTYSPPELEEITARLRGLTISEVDQLVASAVFLADDKAKPDLSLPVVSNFKAKALVQTNLIRLESTDGYSLDTLGGLSNFKRYATETAASWTLEGQAHKLRPPKGLLCVGVWGCGKSLAIKTLGSTWGIPIVSLELGKLRTSAVGGSESNVYSAIRYIESIAPCIVWLDEAEKSLSGTDSSGRSDAGTTARILGILSTWHQETNSKICLCMTANRLDQLPVEFVSRVDDRFFFDLPNDQERLDIIKIHLKDILGLSVEDLKSWNLKLLVTASSGMTSREIVQSILSAMRSSYAKGRVIMTVDHLKKVMLAKPLLATTMSMEVEALRSWVGVDKSGRGTKAMLATPRPERKLRSI